MEKEFFSVVFIKNLNEVEPVPHNWIDEMTNVVYWPPNSKILRDCQSNASSKPDLRSWRKYTCTVKAKGFLIFNHAVSKADQLCNDSSASSTEEEDIRLKKRKKTESKLSDSFSYNSYFTAEKVKTSQEVNQIMRKPASRQSKLSIPKQNEETIIYTCTSPSVTSSPPLQQEEDQNVTIVNNNDGNFKLISETALENLATSLKDFQQAVESKLNSIENQVCAISIKQDQLENEIKNKQCDCQNKISDDQSLRIFPLNSVQEIKDFEENLKDENYKKTIVRHLKQVHGAGQQWRTICYRLSSTIFTKKLLTEYSWTGASRTMTNKESFSKLINILDVFFKVVYHADCTFTHSAKDAFFRDGILKHSNARLTNSNKRNLGTKPKNLEEPEKNQLAGDETSAEEPEKEEVGNQLADEETSAVDVDVEVIIDNSDSTDFVYQ